MKLCVEQRGPLYIGATLTTARGMVVLRRWPWPGNEVGRERHLRAAKTYANSVANVLTCPVEIAEVLQ
jgi:hypothetical protein